MTTNAQEPTKPIRVRPRRLPASLAGHRDRTSNDACAGDEVRDTGVQPVESTDADGGDPPVRRRVVRVFEEDRAWHELLVEVERCRQHIKRLQRKCRTALAAGDHVRARKFQDLILKSRGGALWATFEADRKLRKKDRQRLKDATLIRNVAARMSLYRPCYERVRVSFQRKRSGGYRPICSYDIENRARQYLATFAFKPFSAQGEHQFDSRDKAIEHVSAALSRGFKWVVQVDLKDCFASLDVERLAALIPLPDRVIRHVLAEPPGEARVLGHTPGNSLMTPGAIRTRLGQPQGSASASSIANHLIAHALRAMPALGVHAIYVDDGCFLVKTRKEAEQIKDALYRVFSDDGPVGHIAFKHCIIRRASDGFDFLGYHIRRVDGAMVAIPLDGKTAKVRAVVTHFLGLNREHARLREYVCSWCAAHRHWQYVDAFRERLLARIDDAERLGYDPTAPRHRCRRSRASSQASRRTGAGRFGTPSCGARERRSGSMVS